MIKRFKHAPARRAILVTTLVAWAGLLAIALSLPARAATTDVTVPLRLDANYLRQAMVTQAYAGAGETARVWDDGSGCDYLVLTDPKVVPEQDRLRVSTRGEARVGKAFGERCVLVVDWAGTLETLQAVSVEPGTSVIRFEVVDSALSDGGALGATFWNLVKDHVHPHLGAVRIDLQPSLNELKAILPLLLPGDPASVAGIVESVALHSATVVEDGLEVALGFSVPAGEPRVVEAEAPEPALDEAEMARFQSATQHWDGFITFIVKYLAATAVSPELNRELLFVLLEARYDILRILGEQSAAIGPDPVRTLFLGTWSRLAPILRQLGSTQPGQQGLNLLSFIAAADALAALDAIGPGLAVELSADGLRRMARTLAPETTEDPLQYDEAVDPELRRLFDFGPPPAPPDEPPAESPAEPGEPTQDEPLGWVPGALLRAAHAGTGPDARLVARLNRWVPEREEIGEYLPMVRELLHDTATRVVAESSLDGGLHAMFRAMVLATAWQETCWRQFRRDNGKVVAIKSAGGAVGMMQVIPSVWRGFYDGKGLARDIAYNAAAGSEILMHYLLDYAIARGEHEHKGGVDNLPRAAYAAYNGGPGHLRRYRTGGVSDSLRRIDSGFLEKYRAVAGGDELAVASCFSE